MFAIAIIDLKIYLGNLNLLLGKNAFLFEFSAHKRNIS